MKSLLYYIFENIYEARVFSIKRDDILNIFREEHELIKYLRDEDDDKNCPEKDGYNTYFVLMKATAKRNKICIVEKYWTEAKSLLMKHGWMFNGDNITKNNITIPFRTTGQTYTNKPGAGQRGTTEHNSGNQFENNLSKHPEICVAIIKDIDKLRSYDGHDDIDENASCKKIGGVNTRTKTTLIDIKKQGAKTLLNKFQAKDVADIMVLQNNHQIPLSLKRPKPGSKTITLWNMGLYILPNKTPYECAVEYMKAFLKDKSDDSEYITMVKNVLNMFMGTKWDRDTWKNQKLLKGQSYIPIHNNELDVDYIKDILRYGYRKDYYMIGGEKNEIYGTWIDEEKVETILNGPLTDVSLIVPNTTKLIGIQFKLNGVTYRISMRDRNNRFKFTAGEIVLTNGLTYNMLKNMGINDLVLLNNIEF